MLNPNEEYRPRDQCYFYELPNQQIIEELRTIVDVKILTNKTTTACKNYRLRQVYSVNRYLMSERDIKDLKSCLYVADCGVGGVVESIINTFVVLGYRVGLATVSQEDLRQECVVITTSNAPPQLLQNSWARIDSYECEKGMMNLFLVSTAMHLMKGAYSLILINNTLVLALGYELLRELNPWHVLLLALFENLIIYYVSSHIGEADIRTIETIASVKRSTVFFNITTGCFYLYVFLRLQLVHNQVIFLLCNCLLRGMYVLRYGWFLSSRRWAFLRLHYLLLLLLLAVNILVSYYRDKDQYDIQNGTDIATVREEVMLVVILCFLQILHLVQLKLVSKLRGLS